ncbi:TIGR02611 family protein [Microbacterium sp. gxy059]|uniref:TIGR02611 family protein n=1 Tax=Microbacterium sp. gxy059 TaxID=2957199 RepID=UPI003D96549D
MTADAIQVVEIRPTPAVPAVREEERPGWAVRWGRAMRRLIARNRLVDIAYRVVIGLLGAALVALGLVLVPLPGPGWLVVFAGLAVLATEFRWAHRAAGWLRRQLSRFWAWTKERRERRRARA